jgi:hypothetical protein
MPWRSKVSKRLFIEWGTCMIDRNDGETASYGAMLHRHGAVTFGFLTPYIAKRGSAWRGT